MKRMLAWMLVLCMLVTAYPALSEGVTTPSDLGVPAEPTATVEPEPTATVEPEPTSEPEATAEPTAAAEPEPTPLAWDESVCDHMNANCEQAPVCDLDGCAHLAQDVHGLDKPLCATGEWMISQMNAAGQTVSGSVNLDDGSADILRSGVYTVTGGKNRDADITVADGIQVRLLLDKADAASVSVGKNATLTIETEHQNSIGQMTLDEKVSVIFAGEGAIRVDETVVTEKDPAEIQVRSGSVQAEMTESQGRAVFTFDMQGATGVTVNGSAYPACADEKDKVWLWLSEPAQDAQWQAQVADGVLAIAQEAAATEVPATEVPATEAPVTEAPATEVPTTEAPTTEAPATEVPVTEPPATEVPVTEAPATEVPATEAPWDESECPHLTLECENAPKCDIPDCDHIGKDANDLDIPLCEAGMWLLNQQEQSGIMLFSMRSTPIDLARGDAVIWRSGSYTVLGGKGKLSVADQRVVVITLREAQISELALGKGVMASIVTEGRCAIDTLTAGENTDVSMGGEGHLTVQSPVAVPVSIVGGSVNAKVTEAEGRQMQAFALGQCAKVCVADADIEAVSDDKNNAYLWLPAIPAGMAWISRVQGDTLVVEQSVVLPEGEAIPVESASQTVAVEGCTYRLSGRMDDTALLVDADDVTVLLDGVSHAGAPLIQAGRPYTLIVVGESNLASLKNARVMAEALLTVSGTVENTEFVSGRVVLNVVPEGYEAYELQSPETARALSVDGVSMALVQNSLGGLLLPARAAGELYLMDETEGLISVRVLRNAYDLSVTAEIDLGGETDFVLTGAGAGVVKASGNAQANACFLNAVLDGQLLLTDEKLTVTLEGDNELNNESDAIVLLGDSALTLSCADGRLTLCQQDLTGIALSGNIRVLPETESDHLCLTVTDAEGNAVANRDVVVLIGDRQLACTTFEDGTLHLWGLGDVNGQDAAITDGENVYTAVIGGGKAQATTGLTIANVICADMPDGTVRVSIDCEGAKSGGVQVRLDASDTPDTFDGAAVRYPAQDGTVILKDVKAGQVLVLRAYVSVEENAALTQSNADGFQFSEQIAHIHRVPFPVDQEEAASVTYTGKPYVNPLKLPGDVKVTYTGKYLNEAGQPVLVGEYTMHVTIPETDTTYMAGEYDIPFSIDKITLHIIPESNQEKYAGDLDPAEYPFTVEGLLYYDEVGGVLIREEGEEPGNYRFLTKDLIVKDYYEPRIYSNDAVFTILPAPIVGWNGPLAEELKPIRQTIEKKDGRKVFVTLNTAGNLRVNGTDYGCVVRSTETDFAKNVRPSLSWNEQENKLLLRLRTEPDVNRDGGYATGADGKVIWTGRYLRITYDSLDMIRRKGVDAISLNVKDAALTVSMDDLFSTDVLDYVKSLTRNPGNAYVRVEVVPILEMPGEIAAQSPVTDGWRMSMSIQLVHECYDITSMLKNTTMQVDLEPVAELLESVNIYKAETFREDYTLAVQTAGGELWPVQPALLELPDEDSDLPEVTAALKANEPLPLMAGAVANRTPVYVEPFAADETDKVLYPTLLYTHRYLTLPVPEALSVWCVRAPKPEAPSDDAAEAVVEP